MILLFWSSCHPSIVIPVIEEDEKVYAEFIVKENLMTCFEEGTLYDKGTPYNCELSAVEEFEGSVLLGNDKYTSAVSAMLISNINMLKEGTEQKPFELKQQEFFDVRKIEDFAFTLDKKHLLITSGFDRLKTENNEWDAYNSLIQWEVKKNKFNYIELSEDDGIKSSKTLRAKFLNLLGSVHMKIEGLTFLPANRLIFGVREVGASYENPTYTSTLIECSYQIVNDKIELNDDMKISYRLNSDEAKKELGLSSLVYDVASETIFISTSYELGPEGNQTLGSYLWALPLADYEDKKQADLIYINPTTPLFMPHKAEGITMINENEIFVIHDNDRVDIPVNLPDGSIVSRKPHEDRRFRRRVAVVE